MSTEPENLVLHLLREMREEMEVRAETREGFADVRSEMHSLRADVASDLMVARQEANERIEGLRKAVMTCHSTTTGHGVIIGELDTRVRRLEERMGLPAPH